MFRLVLVCVGGALGSGARYLVQTWASHGSAVAFPRGTFTVNVVGSFLITLILGLATRTTAISPNARLFLTTGIIGGFTTYSSFNTETLQLMDEGALPYALGYVGATVVACLVAGVLGFAAARAVARAAAGLAV